MDPLVASLVNFGGMGLLSAALLLLHRDALKNFREEQSEQRKVFREEQAAQRGENMAMLAAIVGEVRRVGSDLTEGKGCKAMEKRPSHSS